MRSIEGRWGSWLGHLAFVVAYIAAILSGASVLGALARALIALLVMFVVGWLLGLAASAVFQEMLHVASGDSGTSGDHGPARAQDEEVIR